MLFGVFSVISFVSVAMAADPIETVEFGVDFSISKCLPSVSAPDGGSVACSGNVVDPSNIAVQLSNCTTAQDSSICYGTWESTQSLDGYSFKGVVTVAKTTITDSRGNTSVNYGLTAYLDSATDSRQQSNSIAMTLNRGGMVTDSVTFGGPTLTVASSGETYTPSLTIAPKTTAPRNQ